MIVIDKGQKMAEKPKTTFKVARFRILKPSGEMSWNELGKVLRDTRYRTFRLANLAVSEAYLGFHLYRTGQKKDYKFAKMSELSHRLRAMLKEEGVSEEDLNKYSRVGALPDTVAGALAQHKLRAITNKSKWQQVIRGHVSLPVFRGDMAFPIRCDKPEQRRLEKMDSGDVELDLMVTLKPYPRIVLQTGSIGASQEAVLQRLLDNKDNSTDSYRQRLYEVKQDSRTKKWWLYVTYELPLTEKQKLHKDICVGVDLGFSVPVYATLNNGLARLGRRHFQSLGHRIRVLHNQTRNRRRAIQRGGRQDLAKHTARSGHGRKRMLQPINKLQNKINKAYSTINHQLSSAIINFALNHGAGIIQLEDLTGLQEELSGTYLGAVWRYHDLQKFIEYKAQEVGIELRKINPRYTSRRCSNCGYIHIDFDRKFRDKSRKDGLATRFVCPKCEFAEDPDYNAAKNISTLDIENKIKLQCNKQDINY